MYVFKLHDDVKSEVCKSYQLLGKLGLLVVFTETVRILAATDWQNEVEWNKREQERLYCFINKLFINHCQIPDCLHDWHRYRRLSAWSSTPVFPSISAGLEPPRTCS